MAAPDPSANPSDATEASIEAMVDELFDFVDRYPEDAFVKVYPRRLRDFVKYVIAAAFAKGKKVRMTRARIGALVLLGLRVNAEGECWPSANTSAREIGMTSRSGTQYITKMLRQAGALQWDHHPLRGVRRYKLPPGLFIFGRDSYHDKNFVQGGVRNFVQGGVRNFVQGVDEISYTNKNPGTGRSTGKPETQQQPDGARKDAAQTGSKTTRGSAAPKNPESGADPAAVARDAAQQQELQQQLIAAGVEPYEARLIVQQFRPKTISDCLRSAAAKRYIANPGGWIRRTIELRAAQTIKYPNSPDDVAAAIRDMALKKSIADSTQGEERYLTDPYFSRQQQQQPEDGA